MSDKEAPEVYQSTRGFNAIFIHSALDDAGLTAPEFRVYAHLSRRASHGVARAAVDTMAAVCILNAKTVRSCIKKLLARRMITFSAVPGRPNRYYLSEPEKWIVDPYQTDTHPNLAPLPNGHSAPYQTEPGAPTKRGDTKDILRRQSSEGNPKRVKFLKPTFPEMELYAAKIGMLPTEINKFFDYHESKGWVVGRAPMRCWQAAMRTWNANARQWATIKPKAMTLQERMDRESDIRLRRLCPEEYAEQVALGNKPDV